MINDTDMSEASDVVSSSPIASGSETREPTVTATQWLAIHEMAYFRGQWKVHGMSVKFHVVTAEICVTIQGNTDRRVYMIRVHEPWPPIVNGVDCKAIMRDLYTIYQYHEYDYRYAMESA